MEKLRYFVLLKVIKKIPGNITVIEGRKGSKT